MSTNQDYHLNTLSDIAKKGNLILFIGAGLSVGAGLPNWISMARTITKHLNYVLPREDHFISTDHLIQSFQYFENRNGRNILIQRIRELLDTTNADPTEIHQLLPSFPSRIIFSTNYDDLIEKAYSISHKKVHVISSDLEIAYWSEDNTQIIKLCGNLSRPETIAITKRDFNLFFMTRPRLVDLLINRLESADALFLGYSLRDPFFNQIWDTIGNSLGAHRRLGHAIMFNLRDFEIEDLERRKIVPISFQANGNIDMTQKMSSFLRSLLTRFQG